MTLLLRDAVTWKENEEGQLAGFYVDEDGVEREATWTPQNGSQQAVLDCPIFEVLYEGTRAPGKTDTALMDFAQEVGKGWGADWRGIVFRPEHVQLEEIINKAKEWFPRLFPSSTFNEGKSVWLWSTGEKLYFKHVTRLADYWKYHGHQYPFVYFDELTNWKDDKLYRRMMSICRSSRVGMPRKYRSSCNPSGVGHNWVKARFQLPIVKGRVHGPVIRQQHEIYVDGKKTTQTLERVAIHGDVRENKVFLHAQPSYLAELSESATSPAERAAWLEGDWDIVAGGMLDDLWDTRYHVIPNIPFNKIPKAWYFNRSYDHGQTSPFSVGWWAESNGEPIEIDGFIIGRVRGDLIRVAEWYGWNGAPNEGLRMLSTEIADGILEREEDWGIRGRVKPGPADVQAFDPNDPNHSVEGDMRKRGCRWALADKGPNSRVLGWQQLRKMLKGSIPKDGFREFPGMFICERCTQFRRTMPALPRSERNPDDVDSDSEDHIADEVRYRVREKRREVRSRSW